ncbi:gamma-glutamylcyclotransferase [Planctomycetota bacterium]|nr:gamma-glutamylcyclotransferase [Planctomycetota bacterium]
MNKIFVYGTLLKGLERNTALASSKYLGPALIKARLFDLGSYPGIAEGDEDVVGEIYDVDEETLNNLDAIEGYRESAPESSLYLRKPIAARKLADGTSTDVETYFYSCPNEKTIKGLDYRAFRLGKENEQWVIAYGSNISTERINNRLKRSKLPLAQDYIKGTLPGYELVFNKQAGGNNSVYANIRFKEGAEGCPAVAWKLTQEQVAVIDRCEGVSSGHYLKVGMPLKSDDGSTSMAICYIAHPSMIVEAGKVQESYRALVRAGYDEMGWVWPKR